MSGGDATDGCLQRHSAADDNTSFVEAQLDAGGDPDKTGESAARRPRNALMPNKPHRMDQ